MRARASFIHAADLHLGSPLKGIGEKDPFLAQTLRHAVACAFERMIDQAIACEVDFVLIAGDIFDSEEPSYADTMRFIDGMERLRHAGICVFAVTGNHERSGAWQRGFASLPGNVRVFSDGNVEYGVVDRDGRPLCAVVGRGFASRPIEDGLYAMGAEAVFGACGRDIPFAVGLLHTGLDIDRKTVPVSPQALRATHLDYWALGHIHRRCCDDVADPRMAFPGCIQGRDTGEPGDCGCSLVQLEEGMPNRVEFIHLSPVAWESVRVDVSGASSVLELERRTARILADRADALESDLLLARVVFEGSGGLRDALLEEGVLDDMRERLNGMHAGFACDSIECRVSAPVDRNALYEQGMFPAALLSGLDGLWEDRSRLRDVLAGGFGERGLALPDYSDDDLGDLCDRAQDELLAMLLGGSHA
ncbi:MAG: exonuclease SbcCD subunit D [Eggerthellaceae bacterium]